jgi:hypothetical protein
MVTQFADEDADQLPVPDVRIDPAPPALVYVAPLGVMFTCALAGTKKPMSAMQQKNSLIFYLIAFHTCQLSRIHPQRAHDTSTMGVELLLATSWENRLLPDHFQEFLRFF